MDVKAGDSQIDIGFSKTIFLNAVPRIKLTFSNPDSSTVQSLLAPSARMIRFPIRGTATNLHSTIPCKLWWIVNIGSDEPIISDPINGSLVPENGNKFHVNVGSGDPQIDIFKQQLFGKGTLGFKVQPEIPHAEVFTFEPDMLSFNVPCDVTVAKPGQILPGTPIRFTPVVSSVFQNATIKLTITESDSGEGEVQNEKDCMYMYTWRSGDRNPIVWKTGFSHAGEMIYPEAGEKGDFEFDYQLEVAFDNEDYKIAKKATRFIDSVKVPSLKSFKLTYSKFFGDSVSVEGELAGFDPKMNITLQFSLYRGMLSPVLYKQTNVRIDTEDNGKFRGLLFNFHHLPKVEIRPPNTELFAVLSLPKGTWENASEISIAEAIHYDDKKFVGFRDPGQFSLKRRARAICSEEVTVDLVKEILAKQNVETNWKEGYGRKIEQQNTYNDYIAVAAERFNIDPLLFKSLIAQESSFNPNAKNGYGFAGLTQLGKNEAQNASLSTGATNKSDGVWHFDFKNDERFDPEKSILGGAHCLRTKMDIVDKLFMSKYKDVLSVVEQYRIYLAAYNAGEGTIQTAYSLSKMDVPSWNGLLNDSNPSQSFLWKAMKIKGPNWNHSAKYTEITHYVRDVVERAYQ